MSNYVFLVLNLYIFFLSSLFKTMQIVKIYMCFFDTGHAIIWHYFCHGFYELSFKYRGQNIASFR